MYFQLDSRAYLYRALLLQMFIASLIPIRDMDVLRKVHSEQYARGSPESCMRLRNHVDRKKKFLLR